jgi:hypothetical protein
MEAVVLADPDAEAMLSRRREGFRAAAKARACEKVCLPASVIPASEVTMPERRKTDRTDNFRLA